MLLISYEPADSFETPRFSGVRTFMRLPNVQDLENSDVAVVGAPFDTGSSFRVGARFGPEGPRSASNLLRPYNPSLDVIIFDYLSVIDVRPGADHSTSGRERGARVLEPDRAPQERRASDDVRGVVMVLAGVATADTRKGDASA
jgi:arginase family enzyme